MKFKLKFLSWVGKAELEIEGSTFADALSKEAKKDTDLRGSNLRGSNLRGSNLSGSNLSGSDLSGSDLSWSNLSGSDLSGSDLSWSDLSGSNLSGSDLRGSDLSWSNLRGSNLSGSNLSGSNLSGSDLRGSNLRGSNLSGKKLWDTRPFLCLGQCGSRNDNTLVFFFEDGSEPLIRCGCFSGNIKEFRAKIRETHGGTFFEKEYLALASHIAAIYKIQRTKPKGNRTNEMD